MKRPREQRRASLGHLTPSNRKHDDGGSQGDDANNDDDDDCNGRKRRAAQKALEDGGPTDLGFAFDLLPSELVIEILAATANDVASVANLSRTSWRYRRLADDPVLWRRLYEVRFGPPLHADFAQRGKDWRWLYRARACDGRVAGTPIGEIPFTIDDAPAIYRGDLVDGVPHGYGLLLAASVAPAQTVVVAVRYEGHFSQGKYDGYGVCAWDDGSAYQGHFTGGKRHGCGTYKWSTGDQYEGTYVDGIMHGRCVATHADGGRYEGAVADGEPHGYGVRTWPDGERYEGAYVNGKQHGHGVYQWPDGRRYEGGFVDVEMHGHGVDTWPDGERYEGGYANDKRHGYGAQMWADGQRYEGDYSGGKEHGYGVYTWPDGDRYKGNFVDGNKHGFGVYTRSDGTRCEGTYVDDQPHGHGTIYHPDGSRVSGFWAAGVCVGDMTVVAHADPSNPARQCQACAFLLRHAGARRSADGPGPIRLTAETHPSGPCPFSSFAP